MKKSQFVHAPAATHRSSLMSRLAVVGILHNKKIVTQIVNFLYLYENYKSSFDLRYGQVLIL